MKKSLIVIALALLMIVPVFADDVLVEYGAASKAGEKLASSKAQETEVNVTLDLTPRYAFGVTGGKTGDTSYITKFADQNIVAAVPADSTATYVLYDKVKRVEKISLTADYTTMKLKGTETGYEYYISYWFCENNYDKVALVASIDHDLELDESGVAKAKSVLNVTSLVEENTKIPFQVAIEDGKNSVLNSTEKNQVTIVEPDVQTQIAAVEKGDVKITVGPTTTDTLENKYTGTYTAHIILQVVVS